MGKMMKRVVVVLVQCQTPGCPINHESDHKDYKVVAHRHVPAN